MSVRMFLSDGRSIYPQLVSKEQRAVLKSYLDSGELELYCGCDVESRLLYGISSDLRIVPRHQHYAHREFCDRYAGKRTSAYVYDEDGSVVTYLRFNCANFSMPTENKDEETKVKRVSHKDGDCKCTDDEMFFDLGSFVKALNRDAYAERLMQGKSFLTCEYFNSCVSSRARRVRANGKGKAFGELKLDIDGYAFFYGKLREFSAKSIDVLYGTDYAKNYFVPEVILRRAIDKFEKKYGTPLEELMDVVNICVSGFMYKKYSKYGKPYICVGRLHLFVVNKNGLYCDSLFESEFLDNMVEFVKKNKGCYFFPDSEYCLYDGVYSRKGKAINIYYGTLLGDGFACNGDPSVVNEIRIE